MSTLHDFRCYHETLPSPLACVLRELDQERDSFRRMHRLIDAFEVLIKLHSIVLINAWIELTPEAARDKLGQVLPQRLLRPSLNEWVSLAQELRARDDVVKRVGIAGLADFLIKHANELNGNAFDGDEGINGDKGIRSFVALRNHFAHGATPANEACDLYLQDWLPRFGTLLNDGEHLQRMRLLVGLDATQALALVGCEPKPTEHPGLEVNRVYLDTQPQPLKLFLLHQPAEREHRLFIYNRREKRSLLLLDYAYAEHRRLEAPLPDQLEVKEVMGLQATDYRRYLESFVGREDELDRLRKWCRECRRGAFVVWGEPGLGKTALLACFTSQLRLEEDRPVEPIELFLSRNSAAGAAQNQAKDLLRRLSGKSDCKGSLPSALQDALNNKGKELASRGRKLLLLIDGLDELPGFLDHLPRDFDEHVLLLLSSRRVDRSRDFVRELLPRADRPVELDLAKLSAQNIRALLSEVTNKYLLDPTVPDRLAERSDGNPRYLRMVCDDILAGRRQANDVASLPQGLEAFYRQTLDRIAQERPRAITLLCLLAAASESLTELMFTGLMRYETNAALRAEPLRSAEELLRIEAPEPERTAFRLAHETLREHLQRHEARAVLEAHEKLAAFCEKHWHDDDETFRRYCFRGVLSHLQALAANGWTPALADRLNRLVGNPAWRRACLLTCGNPLPLQAALRQAMRNAIDADPNGTGEALPTVVRYLRWMHEEPQAQASKLREDMLDLAKGAKGPGELERLGEYAQLGADAAERCLLLIRALRLRPKGVALPETLQRQASIWLAEASDEALEKLWQREVLRSVG